MTMLKVGGLEDFAVEEEKIMSTLEFKNCNSSFDVGEAISVRPPARAHCTTLPPPGERLRPAAGNFWRSMDFAW